MADVTLLYGIGATKAGTSWLHAWLSGHPEVHLWMHKELHYFDAIHEGRVMQQIDAICARRATLRARMKAAGDPRRMAELATRVAEIDRYLGLIGPGRIDARAYLDFLCEGRGGAHVVGDLTPAYALLPVERLRYMAAISPVTRFVYLMRDPVERLWSNLRAMAAVRGGDAAAVADRARALFDRWAAGEERAVDARSDYAGALRRLFAAVPEPARFVAFHEELFTGATAARLCAFLGIAARKPTGPVVNRGPDVPLDLGRRAIAADRLARQYDEVKSLIGRLPDRWQPMGVEV